MNNKEEHIFFMKKALEQAQIAFEEGEVPVGAIIVKNNEIISCGRNRREKLKNALYHAEIEAIDFACRRLGEWRLLGCKMYVTLEPCPMCAGAIINSRISEVIFGAKDLKSGSCGSVINLFDLQYNYKPKITSNIIEKECSEIIKNFFIELRSKDNS